MSQWNKVNSSHFEHFIYYILGKMKFYNREWFGKGGSDKGRDIVAYSYEELPFNFGYERKWVFQCKRWKRMPTNTEIINEIDTASQHEPDFWVLVIPVNLSANQIEFFKWLNNNKPFKIMYIPLAMIQEFIYEYPETKNILLYDDVNERSLSNV